MARHGEINPLFQRGTTFFIKQDNAFMLPVDTIMISPLGLKFCVLLCIAIDVYTFIIISKLVPFPINSLDHKNYNGILS